MNRDKRWIKVAVILIGFVAGIFYIAAGAYAQQHGNHGQGRLPQTTSVAKQAVEGLDAIYAKKLPPVQEALARAIQHLEAGHQQEALKELRQVQSSLEAVRQALGKHVEPAIVNDRCPIMGSRISTNSVTANLMRTYNGQKVAFCCAGCPEAWDQLDDAQKTAKLASVTARPQPRGTQMKKPPAPASHQHGPSCSH